MKSLILIAHGSRRQQSNDEVRDLTEALRRQAGEALDRVECAFLELAEPAIPEAIDAAAAAGSDIIYVLPYFLNSGRHVAEDIPGIVGEKRRQYPDIELIQTPILGAAPGILDLLLDLIEVGAKGRREAQA
jgi:sirohydrochlorin ferrochelatase